jgi:hypothetical protein
MTDHDSRGRQGPPEHPRSEPEIIPPDRDGGRRRSHVWIWVADREGMRRTAVPIPGPFMILLAFAVAGLVAALVLIVALGAVLFWVPVIILAVGALLLAAAVRQYWQRFRRWAFRR